MRFLYEYRTSDNVVHDGEIAAPNRETAFARLRAQGIRPSVVRDAPGIFNLLFGKGKRWIAIFVLSLGAAVAVLMAVNASRRIPDSLYSEIRHQPMGDVVVIEEGIRTGWVEYFTDVGDRFLVSYVIPGVRALHCPATDADIARVLDAKPSVREDKRDSVEVRQLVSMLSGIKAELREFLSDGGTIEEYRIELAKREDVEIAHYLRAQRELDNFVASRKPEELVRAAWTEKNDSLRKMGIKLLPFPAPKKKSSDPLTGR